jgi:hypothetical protein
MGKRFPEDTLVKFKYLPTIHAQLALNPNDSSKAINTLQVAAPYELGLPGGGAFSPTLYPVYVRGKAYLAAHRGTEAAATNADGNTWLACAACRPFPLAVINKSGCRPCSLGLVQGWAQNWAHTHPEISPSRHHLHGCILPGREPEATVKI